MALAKVCPEMASSVSEPSELELFWDRRGDLGFWDGRGDLLPWAPSSPSPLSSRLFGSLGTVCLNGLLFGKDILSVNKFIGFKLIFYCLANLVRFSDIKNYE
jgi:hypothetical protein